MPRTKVPYCHNKAHQSLQIHDRQWWQLHTAHILKPWHMQQLHLQHRNSIPKIIIKHVNGRLIRPDLSPKLFISRINPWLEISIAHKIIETGSEFLAVGHIRSSMLLHKFPCFSHTLSFKCRNSEWQLLLN